jgi:hypothetical protein
VPMNIVASAKAGEAIATRIAAASKGLMSRMSNDTISSG